MSSHHFVREGQEPALVIIDALSMDTAAPLLEWAPLVVVADTALAEVSLWGVKIDLVLVAERSQSTLADDLQEQQRFQSIAYGPGRLLETAIAVLRKHHNTAANILVEDAGPYIQLGDIESFPITFVTRTLRWSRITKHHFEKWFPKNTAIRVAPENTQFSQHSGVVLADGVYQTISDGLISLKSDHFFWIGEFL